MTDLLTGKPLKRPRRKLSWWLELPLTVVVAVLFALLLKTFIMQPFYIPSESMEPGFVNNDRIVVQKISYWTGEPERGDIVVFRDEHNWLPPGAAEPVSPVAKALAKIGLYPTGGHLVKRVIGVAGDEIVCCDKQGRLSVNGVTLDESSYLTDDPSAPCDGPMPKGGSCKWKIGPIPEGQLFVMGDNRANSGDSSFHLTSPGGPYVDVDDVVGKVFVLLWPFDRFRWVTRPATFDDLD